MWDMPEKTITNKKVRRIAANSPTMESMMVVQRCRWLSKLSVMESQISKANARRMVSTTTTHSETASDHTPCLHNHPKKLAFKEEKGN
jgi:hypothetical protein